MNADMMRTLKHYELYRRLSNRRFVLDVHPVSLKTPEDFGAFLLSFPS